MRFLYDPLYFLLIKLKTLFIEYIQSQLSSLLLQKSFFILFLLFSIIFYSLITDPFPHFLRSWEKGASISDYTALVHSHLTPGTSGIRVLEQQKIYIQKNTIRHYSLVIQIGLDHAISSSNCVTRT